MCQEEYLQNWHEKRVIFPHLQKVLTMAIITESGPRNTKKDTLQDDSTNHMSLGMDLGSKHMYNNRDLHLLQCIIYYRS